MMSPTINFFSSDFLDDCLAAKSEWESIGRFEPVLQVKGNGKPYFAKTIGFGSGGSQVGRYSGDEVIFEYAAKENTKMVVLGSWGDRNPFEGLVSMVSLVVRIAIMSRLSDLTIEVSIPNSSIAVDFDHDETSILLEAKRGNDMVFVCMPNELDLFYGLGKTVPKRYRNLLEYGITNGGAVGTVTKVWDRGVSSVFPDLRIGDGLEIVFGLKATTEDAADVGREAAILGTAVTDHLGRTEYFNSLFDGDSDKKD